MNAETIHLTPETVNAYKELITNPSKYDMPFISLSDYFEKSEEVIAKHELAKSYIDYINRPLPKVILYIIMDDVYGLCNGKDSKGNLGYFLKPKINNNGNN